MTLKSALVLLSVATITVLGLQPAFADTLTYTITGPKAMQAHWFSKQGVSYGVMYFTKTANGVRCENFYDTDDCFAFHMQAVVYPDWRVVYKHTMTWQIYASVKSNSGKKTYRLYSTVSA